MFLKSILKIPKLTIARILFKQEAIALLCTSNKKIQNVNSSKIAICTRNDFCFTIIAVTLLVSISFLMDTVLPKK